MKKLVFASSMELIHLADTTMVYESEGNEVIYIMCDGCIGMCTTNLSMSKLSCKICINSQKKLVKNFPPNIIVKNLSDFLDLIDQKELSQVNFKYNNISDIKKIRFHNVNIGYACISSYMYNTRNLNPLMDKKAREFFDSQLKFTCYLVLLQESIINQFKPDEVTFFNGRFMENRTLVDLCKNKGIHFHACDGIKVTNKKFLKHVFYDHIPQDIKYWNTIFEEKWNDSLIPLYDKEQIGRWFFESKINQRYKADKNYVKNQKIGELPETWDDNKINYVIFNSSEDEFFSISEEIDKSKLFINQIDGICYICKTLLEYKPDVKIYLRVHPNLKDVPYKYHKELYNLPNLYPNLIVIPGNSSISSYTLMDRADKIIVFGSTMGVEAAYAGKTVINLVMALYSFLKICYNPKSIDEFRELLLSDNLKPLDNYNCLKYGYGITNHNVPSYIYFSRDFKSKKEKLSSIFFEGNFILGAKGIFYKFLKKILPSRSNIPLDEA